MIKVLLSAVVVTALLGSDPAPAAGTEACGLVETNRLVLAQLDPVRPKLTETSPASVPAELGGRDAEVETYIQLHLDAAAGDTRSRLMPWPELRSLAP